MVSSPKGCQMHMRSDSETSPSASLPWISSYSWWRRERRMGSPSHPTVETAYPLAQLVSPWQERLRPPHCRATAIAGFPVREPTTSATASVPGLPDFTTLNLQAKP